MAFTREFVRTAAKQSGVELPKELEDALINEHISTRHFFQSRSGQSPQGPQTGTHQGGGERGIQSPQEAV